MERKGHNGRGAQWLPMCNCLVLKMCRCSFCNSVYPTSIKHSACAVTSSGGSPRKRHLTREVPGQNQGFPRLPSQGWEGVTSILPEQMSGSGIPHPLSMHSQGTFSFPQEATMEIQGTRGPQLCQKSHLTHQFHSHCKVTRPTSKGSRTVVPWLLVFTN